MFSLWGCSGGALVRQAAQFNARGAAQLARGDMDAAEASLHLALEYNSRYSEPYNNLGLVALSRGRISDARLYFRRAVGLNPDFAEAWSNLGLALLRPAGGDDRGDHSAAVEAFRESLGVDPMLVAPRINMVRSLLQLRRFTDALDHARRAVQVDPRNATAHALRAEAALALSQDEEATDAARRAERLAPFAVDVLLTSARVHAASGRFDEALARIARIENDEARGPDARALRAVVERARNGG